MQGILSSGDAAKSIVRYKVLCFADAMPKAAFWELLSRSIAD
jgi:hypothetical protein